jgi:hypothetical protein
MIQKSDKAMEDETDHLRRNSCSHTTIESSSLSNKKLQKNSNRRGKHIKSSFETTGLCNIHFIQRSSADTFLYLITVTTSTSTSTFQIQSISDNYLMPGAHATAIPTPTSQPSPLPSLPPLSVKAVEVLKVYKNTSSKC